MSLYQPFGLFALLPVALLPWWCLRRRPVPYAVRYTNVPLLAEIVGRRRSWRRLFPGLLFLFALVLASVAVARPYRRVLVPLERGLVVLVMDVSGSMRATDVRPSRIEAAQEAARALVSRLPRAMQVALIAFSFEPEVMTPPTTDRRLLSEAIDALTPGGSTAIGDALATAVMVSERFEETASSLASRSAPDPRGLVSIVLLSDGSNNSGRLQPLAAARTVRAAGVPVYTVALGSRKGAWVLSDTGLQRVAPPDVATLRAIAAATGGKVTSASDAATLRRTYTGLGQHLGRRPGREEISSLLLGASALLLLTASVLGTLWSPRLP